MNCIYIAELLIFYSFRVSLKRA